jgi:hypothetical protein
MQGYAMAFMFVTHPAKQLINSLDTFRKRDSTV